MNKLLIAGVVLETVRAGHEPDGWSRLDFAAGTLLVGQRGEAIGTRLRLVRIKGVALLA